MWFTLFNKWINRLEFTNPSSNWTKIKKKYCTNKYPANAVHSPIHNKRRLLIHKTRVITPHDKYILKYIKKYIVSTHATLRNWWIIPVTITHEQTTPNEKPKQSVPHLLIFHHNNTEIITLTIVTTHLNININTIQYF